jgi:response regulator RpfG family c-di-GMP phosphodiesterase
VAHHEHWDGQGSPDHGAGETIPPGVRRIVFVDSQDALTSRRVGREALTTEQAGADLQWCAGS